AGRRGGDRVRRGATTLEGKPAPEGPAFCRSIGPRSVEGPWRWRWDLNPRWACTHTRFRGVLLRPLGHATADEGTKGRGLPRNRLRPCPGRQGCPPRPPAGYRRPTRRRTRRVVGGNPMSTGPGEQAAAAPAPLEPPQASLTLTAPPAPAAVVATQAPAMAPQVAPELVPELDAKVDGFMVALTSTAARSPEFAHQAD